ncbi:hypothetical protein ABEB36_003669 [Hypothenemus hampei]|uniref:Uncharacterized protein n=1 Tax=Hypothenemus hampei TaxID=57062 RepID=A0ABD1F1B7_HYPHA
MDSEKDINVYGAKEGDLSTGRSEQPGRGVGNNYWKRRRKSRARDFGSGENLALRESECEEDDLLMHSENDLLTSSIKTGEEGNRKGGGKRTLDERSPTPPHVWTLSDSEEEKDTQASKKPKGCTSPSGKIRKKKRPNTHSRENENKQTNGDRQGKGSNSPTPTREINKPETNTSSETGVKSDIIGTHLEELLSKLRDQVAIVDEIMKKAHKPKKELKDACLNIVHLSEKLESNKIKAFLKGTKGKEKITTKKDEGSLQKEITELRRENKTLMSRMQALEEDMRKVVVKKEKEIETLLTEKHKTARDCART